MFLGWNAFICSFPHRSWIRLKSKWKCKKVKENQFKSGWIINQGQALTNTIMPWGQNICTAFSSYPPSSLLPVSSISARFHTQLRRHSIVHLTSGEVSNFSWIQRWSRGIHRFCQLYWCIGWYYTKRTGNFLAALYTGTSLWDHTYFSFRFASILFWKFSHSNAPADLGHSCILYSCQSEKHWVQSWIWISVAQRWKLVWGRRPKWPSLNIF